MAFVPALISGIGALGGLFGNRAKQSTTTNTTQSNNFNQQSGGYETDTTPTQTPQGLELLQQLLGQYSKLSQNTNLAGYQANQTKQINDTSDVQQKALQANLAARGIQGPAAANALAQNDNTRFGNITQLNNSIPLLQQQLQQQNLGIGASLYNMIPRGTNTGNSYANYQQGNQNQYSTGTTTQPGNMLGGLFGNLGSILAGLYGKGAFGGPQGS